MNKVQVSLSVKDSEGKVTKLADDINNLSPEDKAIAIGVLDTLNQADRPTDVFLWGNKVDGIKRELSVELFLFNKNYTPYSIRWDENMQAYLNSLFLFDVINDINLGAGTGLKVVDLELSQEGSQDNVLLRTDLSKVGRAETLIHLIENERRDIVEFSEQEHEFKRIKGIVARFTSADTQFYIVKHIEQGKVISGSTAWGLNGGTFSGMKDEVAVKIPSDNQVLITGNDIFIFNQSKFEKLFNYDYVRLLAADKKVVEFEKAYKISVPNGFDGIHNFLRESTALLNKFLDTEVGMVTQEQIGEVADAMQIELMIGDAGEIILMDKADLNVMLDIINDNYYQSSSTGHHYVAKKKKEIEVA